MNVDVEGVYGKYRDHDSFTSTFWLILYCKGSLDKKLEDFYIIDLEEYMPGRPTKPLTGDLIPYIYKEQYDDYSYEILNKYYPEAFDSVKKIDVDVLASRMGLKVINHSISKNRKVFGQLYFDDVSSILYDEKTEQNKKYSVKKNTLIVDTKATYLRAYGCRNMTVAHECIHAYLHRKAFRFAQIVNEQLSYIQCGVDGVMKGGSKKTQTEWMEIQANGIAPCIIMPKGPFLQEANRLFGLYSSVTLEDTLEVICEIIKSLSKTFGATIYAVRKRLIDLGFEVAVGAFNWVDDGYVRPYAFKRGSLSPTETFTISYKDIFQKITDGRSPLIYDFFEGKLQFVENHVVVNSDKYIDYVDGNPILSEYARYHMDECCVKFEYKSINGFGSGSEFGLMCYLCRDCTKEIEFDLSISGDKPEILKDPNFAVRYNTHKDNVQEIIDNISRLTFNEILNYLMDYLDINITELSIDSGKSERTIGRYLNGENKVPEKRTVVALLRALNLPLEICNICIRQAGIAFVSGNREDDALLTVMQSFRNCKVNKADEFLESLGFEKLSKN